LLLASALDALESAAGLELLRNTILPNATKFVVTNGKLDTQKLAKTFNVESGYPAEPVHLQTLAAWAEASRHDPRYRDGYDLFCLRKILAAQDGFDLAVLLRGPVDLGTGATLVTRLQGRLFRSLQAEIPTDPGADERTNVLFDLRDQRIRAFLDHARELYVTGAVYGITPYSFERALSTAGQALQIEEEVLSQSARRSIEGASF
jgi:hypothetical protein